MKMPMQPFSRHLHDHHPSLHQPQNSTRIVTEVAVTPHRNENPEQSRHTRAPPAPVTVTSYSTPPVSGKRAIKKSSTATQANISSSPSATVDHDHGLLSRLLRLRPSRRKSVSQINSNSSPPQTDNHTNTGAGNYVSICSTVGSELLVGDQRPQTTPKTHCVPSATPDHQTSEASSKKKQLPRVAPPRGAVDASQASTTAVPAHLPSAAAFTVARSDSKATAAMPPSVAPSRLQPRRSFRERFWSKSGANDFGEDDNKSHYRSNKPTAVYVPKHAASDFSRTALSPRHRHSYSLEDDRNIVIRPLATIAADAGEDQDEHSQHVTPAKQHSSNTSLTHNVLSPQQHAEKTKELTAIGPTTTSAAAAADHHQIQDRHHAIPAAFASYSRSAQAQNRGRSFHRHSYSLISDPHDRTATSNDGTQVTPTPDPWLANELRTAKKPQRRSAPPISPAFPDDAANTPRQMPSSSDQQHEDDLSDEVEPTDYQLFVANAVAQERAQQAQIWRTLSQRSQNFHHELDAAAAQDVSQRRSSKRDSAYYSTGGGKRLSGVTLEDSRRLSGIMAQSAARPSADYTLSSQAQGSKTLQRQGSITQKIADYIKPPRISHSGPEESYRPPSRTAMRRSDGLIRGPSFRQPKFAEGLVEER